MDGDGVEHAVSSGASIGLRFIDESAAGGSLHSRFVTGHMSGGDPFAPTLLDTAARLTADLDHGERTAGPTGAGLQRAQPIADRGRGAAASAVPLQRRSAPPQAVAAPNAGRLAAGPASNARVPIAGSGSGRPAATAKASRAVQLDLLSSLARGAEAQPLRRALRAADAAMAQAGL